MIQVSIRSTSQYPCSRKKLRETVRLVCDANGIEHGAVSILIVGTRRMKELNEGLMKHEGVTDVLSFPQIDHEQPEKHFPVAAASSLSVQTSPQTLNRGFHGEPLDDAVLADGQLRQLGDIVVCYPVARAEAAKKGKLVDDQLCFLVDHGMHHLLGFHHE